MTFDGANWVTPSGSEGNSEASRESGTRYALHLATVFLIDPDPAAQRQTATVANSLCRQIETYNSAVAFCEKFSPDRAGCIVSELCLPDGSGLHLLKTVRSTGSEIPLLFVTSCGDVASAVEAMRAGALDIVEKPASENVLAGIVEQAIQQDAQNRAQRTQEKRHAERLGHLTRRERQVMNLAVEGLSRKEMAARIGVSVKTIEVHRSNLMRKLHVHNIAQLIRVCSSSMRATNSSNPF